MEYKNITLSKISQIQYIVWFHLYEIPRVVYSETESRMVAPRGWGGEEKWVSTEWIQRFSVRNERVLPWYKYFYHYYHFVEVLHYRTTEIPNHWIVSKFFIDIKKKKNTFKLMYKGGFHT